VCDSHLLTSSTEDRTASDTLCRSSAAVPGLLSPRVNLRVSVGAGIDILLYKLTLTSRGLLKKSIKNH